MPLCKYPQTSLYIYFREDLYWHNAISSSLPITTKCQSWTPTLDIPITYNRIHKNQVLTLLHYTLKPVLTKIVVYTHTHTHTLMQTLQNWTAATLHKSCQQTSKTSVILFASVWRV